MTAEREVLDLREAAAYLGLSTDTLYRYAGERRLPCFKMGNRWKFRRLLLNRWMDEQSAAKESAAQSEPER